MAEQGNRLAEIVQRLGRDEAKALADEFGALWRGDAKVADRLAVRLAGVFRELGLVTREELEEAELVQGCKTEQRLQVLTDEVVRVDRCLPSHPESREKRRSGDHAVPDAADLDERVVGAGAKQLIDSYLIDLTLPPAGTVCR